MTDINRVILVGRLVKDAELKFTSASTPVTRFSVAVNRSRKNGDQWEEEVSYIDIVLWGRSAESISKFLTKGKQVAVEGELRQNRWEQDGQQLEAVMHSHRVSLAILPRRVLHKALQSLITLMMTAFHSDFVCKRRL